LTHVRSSSEGCMAILAQASPSSRPNLAEPLIFAFTKIRLCGLLAAPVLLAAYPLATLLVSDGGSTAC
jgi:hypothetical protein